MTTVSRTDTPAPEPVAPTHGPEHGPLPPGRLLLILAGIALLAAAAELLVMALRKVLFGHVLRVSRDIVWMAPLGELMLLLPVAAGLYAGGRLWPRLRSLPVVLFVLLFIVLCSSLLFTGFLHDFAVMLLAAGIAWRLTQLASARGERLYRPLRLIVPSLAVVFLLLGAGLRVSDLLRERRALAALPAAAAGAPNVILIIWDTVRSASLGLYGHVRPTTPNLERLASRGVVFDRAISTTSWTLPSHVSMLTGRLPHETTANWDSPFDGSQQTLTEVLADRGYVTGAFAANVLYVQWENGLDEGFSRFEDYRVTPGQVFLSTALGRRIATGRHGWGTGLLFRVAGYTEFLGRKRADDVNRRFTDWVEQRGDRPYFAMLNYYDAHLPYLPPEPFAGRFGVPRPETSLGERLRRELSGAEYWDMTPAALAAEVAAYEESIAYLDDRLGMLMEDLEAHGQLDNTVIIVTSDHGEEFGEHDDFEHGTNLHMEQIRVPLVVVYPERVPAGIRVSEPVSIRDIPRTVAELLQLDGSVNFPGFSLASTWDSAPDPPRMALAELTPGLQPDEVLCSVVSARHQLMHNPDGSLDLFDLVADPDARRDLADHPQAGAVLTRLHSVVDDRTGCRD